MDRVARVSIGIFSLAGLILSVIVHVAALSGVDVVSLAPSVWLLHLGVFVAFVPMVIFARLDRGAMPTGPELLDSLPTWARYLGFALVAYTIINFLLFMAGTEGGSAQLRDGHYILTEHGKFIRDITAQEYAAFQANVARRFSGHWMFFYAVSSAFFLLGKRPSRPDIVA
jgi:hypothetical protein